jgi:hypothetical protein
MAVDSSPGVFILGLPLSDFNPEMANFTIIVVLAAVLILDCLWLVWEWKRTKNRASMRDALIKKLWKDIEVKNQQIIRNIETIRELTALGRKQQELLDQNPYYVEMRKTQAGLKREYRERSSMMGPPAANVELSRLGQEKERLQEMIRTAEEKFKNKEMEATTHDSILSDYHKKLIEVEVQMRPLEDEKPVSDLDTAILDAKAPQNGDEAIRAAVEKSVGGADNSVVLISASSETHGRLVAAVLDIFVREKGMGGVYISVSQPYEVILSTMEATGIDSKDIYFIDCISKMAGQSGVQPSDKVVFIENPSGLEEVSMHVERLLSKVSREKKFVFLDSLSSLLIYNDDKSVMVFTHYLINKIRLEKMAGAILSIAKKEAEDLVKTIAPMCDSEVRI